MKLILDFGNTLKKFALFEDNELVKLKTLDGKSSADLEQFTREFVKSYSTSEVKQAIISSVVNYPEAYREYLNTAFNLIELSQDTPLPIRNLYKTPATLGKDRLAVACAAHVLFPDSNVLAIVAGTSITYDFVERNGNYLGGAISPGMNTRFKALHTFTDQLPLLEGRNSDTLIGRNTEESIMSGVMNGITAEMDGFIDKYSEIYENLTVLLSGGDLNYFDKRLKNNIFAIPNLVMSGLNIILDFNEKN